MICIGFIIHILRIPRAEVIQIGEANNPPKARTFSPPFSAGTQAKFVLLALMLLHKCTLQCKEMQGEM